MILIIVLRDRFQSILYSNMQSRIRKYRKSAEKFEEAIEKQLNSDFQVHQYLNENKLEGSNIEEYVHIYNTLLVEKQHTTNRLCSLKVNYNKLNEGSFLDNESQLEAETWNGNRSLFCKEYQTIEQQTSGELEVRDNLLKQIVETKKSLNFLKGDIGHLINRNETAKLLSSKIAKVKIVANDQLKRVSLAFTKDKEEIKLKNDMQKKFNKKLKNLSQVQDSSLARMKKNYISNVQRKKEIFSKLEEIERLDQSIGQYGDLERQKNANNRRVLLVYTELKRLSQIIERFPRYQQQFQSNPNVIEIVKKIRDQEAELLEKCPYLNIFAHDQDTKVDSTDIEFLDGDCLAEFEYIIVKGFDNLKNLIRILTDNYNEQIKKKEESARILQQLFQEEQIIARKFDMELDDCYRITPTMLENYSAKIKAFGEIVKMYFCLLQFTDKIPRRSNLTSQKELQSSSELQILDNKCDYITALHEIYKILGSDQTRNEGQDTRLQSFMNIQGFYAKMEKQIAQKLQFLKQTLVDGTYKQHFPHFSQFKPPRSMNLQCLKVRRTLLNNQPINTEERIDTKENILIVNEDSVSLVRPKHDSKYHSNRQESSSQSSFRNSAHLKRGTKSPIEPEPMKAQRIKLLENIDQDYYKMLKSTLCMEKQNTRKNYLFLRNFKRSKFSSRDEILEQKRFEASFSFLLGHSSKPVSTKPSTSSLHHKRLGKSQQLSFSKHVPKDIQQRFNKFGKQHTFHESRVKFDNRESNVRLIKKEEAVKKSYLINKAKSALLYI